MAANGDDRLMTEAEFAEFIEVCDRQEQSQELMRLAAENVALKDQLATIEKKCADYRLYIKTMNTLAEEREIKVTRLKETQDQLEKELLKLRI